MNAILAVFQIAGALGSRPNFNFMQTVSDLETLYQMQSNLKSGAKLDFSKPGSLHALTGAIARVSSQIDGLITADPSQEARITALMAGLAG